MLSRVTTGRGLAVIAAASLLSVAIAAPAYAQKVKNKKVEPVTEQEFSVSIPEVEVVESSLDADTIKAILTGSLAENAEALAELNATRISVPEISISINTTIDGEATEATLTFQELVLEDVVDGVAASASLGGSAVMSDEGMAHMLSTSAKMVDIAGILGIYGLVGNSGSTQMKTLYSDFVMEGGMAEAEDVSCEFGQITGAEVRGRPLETSFAEMISLAQQLEDNPEDADPKTMGRVLRMYADILTAFESSEFTFDGFSCNGVDDDDRPMTFAVGAVTMAGMSPGIYPAISVDDFSVEVEGDGQVSLDNFTIKQFDLSSTIETLNSAPEEITEDWFEENARGLIPAFEGFSFGGLAIDIPDPDVDGQRIVADIDDFNLTLANYINGIPSFADTSASGIRVALPETSSDPQLQQLLDLGVTEIDAGFRLAAAWDEESDSIDIQEISISGVDLATVVLSGTLANATSALFSLDEDEALMAGMEVALSALSLDVTDAGLADLVLALVAKEQNADPKVLRPVFAGLAEGTVVGLLAGAADAAKLGSAINSFVSGKAKSLNISIEAKEAPGLGMLDFMAAEDNPALLLEKVNISAAAK